MNAVRNEFGQRIPTPMQVLARPLNDFLQIPSIQKVNLNAQRFKLTVVGGYEAETYTRKPVTFDCVYLYSCNQLPATFSFSFNFKGLGAGEQVVRATLKYKDGSGVEYSAPFSVKEMKTLMGDFFASFPVERMKALSAGEAKEFVSTFASVFKITVSEKLAPSEIKRLKGELVSKVQLLNGQMKANAKSLELLKQGIRSGKGVTDADRQKMTDIVNENSAMAKQLRLLVAEGTKDIPAAARKLALSELKIDPRYMHYG